MKTEPISSYCPKCNTPLLVSAPEGLCRKCLLAAVATPTEAGQAANAGSIVPPSREAVAAAFPQLEILGLIGSGGMGVVYKARQPRLDRCVALKLLPHSLAADATFTERFNREARVLARLNHPGIVTVYDFGDAGGFFFLLMEFVDGVNLRQAMQTGRFTPQQAFSLVPKICEALQFAHDEGILHRDIKPENILLDAKGRVKIADFGIAKLVGEQQPFTKLTATGATIGTPNYMAPEQLEHPEDVDQRADVYSIGVVFYEMLTGELPIGRFAPPSQKTSIDERVDEIVLKALARERELRQQSAGEVKTQVENLQTSRPRGELDRPAPTPGLDGSAPQVLQTARAGAGKSWSHLAIWGAALTGLSLPLPLLILAAGILGMGGLGPGELWIMLGCVACLGVPGTLLGWMALSHMRRSHGQLQGLPLALFAALTWPFLVAFLGTLLPPIMIVTTEPVWWGPALLLLPIAVLVFGVWGRRATARWGSGSAEEVRKSAEDITTTASLPPEVTEPSSTKADIAPPAAPDWHSVWLGLTARVRLLVKAAVIVLAIALAWVFVFYRIDYVKVGYAMVRTGDVGWGAPWLSFWRSPDQNMALQYGLDFFTFSFAAGLGSAALWILYARLRTADRRVNRPNRIPWVKRKTARVAVALCAGLGIMILALALAFFVWLPRLEKTNRVSSLPRGTSEDSVAVEVSAPPRDTFVITGIVLSNNVPVSGRELRAKLSPPSGRKPSPFVVRWQTVKDGSAGTPWEIVVEDKVSGTIVARLRPANLPQLAWASSPQAERTTSKSATHEAWAFEVARALQTTGGGNAGAADWSVRLQFQSAPPQPTTSKRGIDADFVLPPQQVAVFEVVTRSNGIVVSIPQLAAYVVNGAEGPYTGKFLWVDDPEDLDSLTGVPRWRFGIIGPDGSNLHQGLGVPTPPADYAGNLDLWTALKPDAEVIEGLRDSAASRPAYGLRIRTLAYNTAPGQTYRSTGQGTNWVAGTASPRAPTAP